MAHMEVANPIYDVVFKYLLQNDRVARLLIARITGLAVQSLTVRRSRSGSGRSRSGNGRSERSGLSGRPRRGWPSWRRCCASAAPATHDA